MLNPLDARFARFRVTTVVFSDDVHNVCGIIVRNSQMPIVHRAASSAHRLSVASPIRAHTDLFCCPASPFHLSTLPAFLSFLSIHGGGGRNRQRR